MTRSVEFFLSFSGFRLGTRIGIMEAALINGDASFGGYLGAFPEFSG